MTELRLVAICIASTALLLANGRQGRTQTTPLSVNWTLGGATKKTAEAEMTCKIYSLADFAGDPDMCKWIADTIPQMIQPGTWSRADGTGSPAGAPTSGPAKMHTLSYYAPAKVMVIHHSHGVHAQIDEFLQNLKKAVPHQRAKSDVRIAQH